jgi:predicted GNAT family acetyltransferase
VAGVNANAPDEVVVVDEQGEQRFVVRDEPDAELTYSLDGDRLFLRHTGVPEALEGRGIGGRLVRAAVERARREQLTLVPWCPFARRWLQDHPAEVAGIEIDYDTPRP